MNKIRLSGLAVFMAIAVLGCSITQKQATYKTLSAASSALNIGTAAWKSYVAQARADGSVSQETLIRQAIQVQSAITKAATALNVAIDVAQTTDGPVPSDVARDVADAVLLINQFKK